MPKLVSEIAQGSSNERSVDGGMLADASTRKFRVILNAPNEAYDVQQEIGVYIGDPHPINTGVPCVSISEQAEGESRVVRIVTVNYRTTPGDAGGGEDPNSQPPDIRPARMNISVALAEMPVREWADVNGADVFEPATNPAGDMYDGITRLDPIINISIEQFDMQPTSGLLSAGDINEDAIRFLGMGMAKHTCMLRGISVRPHVETWGVAFYRGFMRTFEFSYNYRTWNKLVPISGMNILNKNLSGQNVENEALNLEHLNGKVRLPPAGPIALASGLAVGARARAMIPIHFPGGGWCQRPSAMPVPLNMDGTPRSRDADPPVLIGQYRTQYQTAFGDNFVNLGVRLADAL